MGGQGQGSGSGIRSPHPLTSRLFPARRQRSTCSGGAGQDTCGDTPAQELHLQACCSPPCTSPSPRKAPGCRAAADGCDLGPPLAPIVHPHPAAGRRWPRPPRRGRSHSSDLRQETGEAAGHQRSRRQATAACLVPAASVLLFYLVLHQLSYLVRTASVLLSYLVLQQLS